MKKTPSKVAQKNSNSLFFLTAWAAQTAQTAQTEELMFQNVAYRTTVYRTGVLLLSLFLFTILEFSYNLIRFLLLRFIVRSDNEIKKICYQNMEYPRWTLSKPRTMPHTRLLKCFILITLCCKTKHLRSLVRSIIWGFEWIEILGKPNTGLKYFLFPRILLCFWSKIIEVRNSALVYTVCRMG